MKKILVISYDYGEHGVGIYLKSLNKYLEKDKTVTYLLSDCKFAQKNKINFAQISKVSFREVLLMLNSCDVIYITAHNTVHLKIALWGFLLGKPIICHYHNFFYNPKKRILSFFKKLIILNFCNLISVRQVFITNTQLINFSKFTIKYKNSVVIPNFIDDDEISSFKLNPNKANNAKVLFVGRFDYLKGIDVLIDVASINPGIQFTLVGGNLNSNHSNLNSLGYIDNYNIQKIYDDCVILFLPSRLEVFPMVLLEAMSRGLVVVCSDLPGLDEIIEKYRNGYLFSVGNSAQASFILNMLLRNKELMNTISANNLKDIKKYSSKVIVPKLLNVINEVC